MVRNLQRRSTYRVVHAATHEGAYTSGSREAAGPTEPGNPTSAGPAVAANVLLLGAGGMLGPSAVAALTDPSERASAFSVRITDIKVR